MTESVEASIVSLELFKALKIRLKESTDFKLATVSLRSISNTKKFIDLMSYLKNNKLIEYDTVLGLVILRITEKGTMRIMQYDSW